VGSTVDTVAGYWEGEGDELRGSRHCSCSSDKAAAEKGKGKRGRKRKVPAREAESDTKDKLEGGAHALDVGLLMCASKDKRTKQTGVEEPKP
jgi:hypothetical protein